MSLESGAKEECPGGQQTFEEVMLRILMNLGSQALRESPWGKQFMQEEALRMLQRLLRERFGELPSSVESDLSQLSAKQLEDLVGVGIKVDSLEEFIAAVPAMAV